MKIFKTISALGLSVLLLSSCDLGNASNDSVELKIENDPVVLAAFVSKVNRPLISNAPTASKNNNATIAVAPTLSVVTEITAPVIPAGGLSASHIAVSGTRMYVTYHLNSGSNNTSFGGAIQVFDFATETMVSSATNEAIDWNFILVDSQSDRLLIAGENNDKGAILHMVPTSAGDLSTNDNTVINLGGVSSNAVARTLNMVFVSTGGSSSDTAPGLYAFDAADLSINPSLYASTGLKQVSYNTSENELVVLKENGSNNAELIFFDDAVLRQGTFPQLNWANALNSTVDLGVAIFPTRGRNGVHIDQEDVAFIPMGNNGIISLDVNDNNPTIIDTEEGSETVNSVTTDANYLYACESNGFSIYSRSGSRGATLSLQSFINEEQFVENTEDIALVSINEAATFSFNGNNYVAVAAGRAGVKIIRVDIDTN